MDCGASPKPMQLTARLIKVKLSPFSFMATYHPAKCGGVEVTQKLPMHLSYRGSSFQEMSEWTMTE